MNNQDTHLLVNLPETKIIMGDTLIKSNYHLKNYLTEHEHSHYHRLNTTHQQNQFKKIREIRTSSLGLKEIKYTDYGAPYVMEQNTNISISHKNNYVVFGYSTFKIGVDLEQISERVKKVKSKFLTEQELNEFSNETNEIYTQLWAAKEAIYKIMTPPVNFKHDILLTTNCNGMIIANIANKEDAINLNFLRIEDYILCYVLL